MDPIGLLDLHHSSKPLQTTLRKDAQQHGRHAGRLNRYVHAIYVHCPWPQAGSVAIQASDFLCFPGSRRGGSPPSPHPLQDNPFKPFKPLERCDRFDQFDLDMLDERAKRIIRVAQHAQNARD